MAENGFVSIGNYKWQKSPSVLYCNGLGSCVAIGFYDIEKKEGVLVHTLLPFAENSDTPYYYVNLAVKEFAERLKERIKRGRIVSKLCGGATIFAVSNKSVGERNAEAAKYWLKFYKIPIAGEDLGGNHGRNVVFELATGKMIITTSAGEQIVI